MTQIENKIHQIWVPPGSNHPMPQVLRAASDTWQDLHPDWEYKLWTDEDLQWLKHRDLYDNAPSLVPPDAVGQLRADIARYEILARYGGFYADLDTVCLKPIDNILGEHFEFAAWEDSNWVGNTYLGCIRDNEVMHVLLDGLRGNIKNGIKGWRPNRLTGPRYLTPIWLEHGAYAAPSKHFYPYSYVDIKAGTIPTQFGPEVISVHLWMHTRQMHRGWKPT